MSLPVTSLLGQQAWLRGPPHNTTCLRLKTQLTRGHVLDEAREEGLFLEVGVVLLEVSLAGRDELHGGELEAAALEARDDLTDETCVRVYEFSLLAWGRLSEL